MVIPATYFCHSRESGNPGLKESGSPIKLGMTAGVLSRVTVTMDPYERRNGKKTNEGYSQYICKRCTFRIKNKRNFKDLYENTTLLE